MRFVFQDRSAHPERRTEEIASLYPTARPPETSKHSVTAASELLARSGFQPYRPEHHPPHAPPPAFTLDPAAYNPYHHTMYPAPHLSHPYR